MITNIFKSYEFHFWIVILNFIHDYISTNLIIQLIERQIISEYKKAEMDKGAKAILQYFKINQMFYSVGKLC